MSTHNIGFYEDLTKIFFELSSNIIKYVHYLFFCGDLRFLTIYPPVIGYLTMIGEDWGWGKERIWHRLLYAVAQDTMGF